MVLNAVEANGDPRSHSPESRNSDVRGPGSVSGEGLGLGERAMMENGNGSDRVGNVKAETIAVDNREKMVLGASRGSGSNLPENGDGNIGASGGWTRQSPDIIEINDSDDDSTSSATLSRKQLSKQGCQHEADLGLEDVNNEAKLLKRKRTSCSNSKGDSGGSYEPRASKCQVLIQDPEKLLRRKSSKFTASLQNQGFDKVDAARGTALAEFLTNGDPHGKLKKSMMELVADDPGGFRDCKRLAVTYSKQLFEMWHLKGDPLFFK
ncbi:hypothetical protein OIU74_007174 [Salix koriyanagi]|uniref:Uncharacterized protein n=1 Tax=Salix koriyanagi TaxID=2511006 RepID=A0A9Q0U2Z0_9ROSI|nr:hypothetical protein OIU74_007174 [Salix koriyanagi]